ncbi:transcription factor 7-like 1 [Sarotherodon galilaeus]
MDEEGKMVSSDSAYMSSTEDGQTPITYPYNEELTHKTILVGDSGVGKTSLLVQFDQGKFIAGSFTSTVGIGFTVSPLFIGPSVHLSPVCMGGGVVDPRDRAPPPVADEPAVSASDPRGSNVSVKDTPPSAEPPSTSSHSCSLNDLPTPRCTATL